MSESTRRATRPMMALLLAGTAAILTACGEPAPGSVDVVESLDDVDYYYACANEVLELPDGRSFYPLYPEEQEEFDESPYEARPSSSAWGGVRVAVADPGPGDDTGTLTIYEDGMARWESDSGTEAWLSEEPLEYEWVC